MLGSDLRNSFCFVVSGSNFGLRRQQPPTAVDFNHPTGVIEGNMIQLQFVAAGAYNASPTAVDPLPVRWYVVPQATAAVYTLTSQPFDIACQTGSSSSRSPRRILTHPTAARSPAKSSRTWSSIIRSARKAALSRPLLSMRHAPSRRVRNHFGISRCTAFTR